MDDQKPHQGRAVYVTTQMPVKQSEADASSPKAKGCATSFSQPVAPGQDPVIMGSKVRTSENDVRLSMPTFKKVCLSRKKVLVVWF